MNSKTAYLTLLSAVITGLVLLSPAIIAAQEQRVPSPIRTNNIKQFCISKFSTNQRLQEACQRRQRRAIDRYMELNQEIPTGAPRRAMMEECLIEYYQGVNGYDWHEVVACAEGPLPVAPPEPEEIDLGPRPFNPDGPRLR